MRTFSFTWRLRTEEVEGSVTGEDGAERPGEDQPRRRASGAARRKEKRRRQARQQDGRRGGGRPGRTGDGARSKGSEQARRGPRSPGGGRGRPGGDRRDQDRTGGPRRSAGAGLTDPRRLAIEVLTRIDADDAYANIALRHALDRSHLADRDRALATELVYGATRMRRACDALVDPFV